MTNQKKTTGENATKSAVSGTIKNLTGNQKKGLVALLIVVAVFGGYFAYQQFIAKPADDKVQTQLTDAYMFLARAQQAQSEYVQVEAMPDSTVFQTLVGMGAAKKDLVADSVAIAVKDYRTQSKMASDKAYQALLKGEQKFPGLLKLADNGGNGGNIAKYLTGLAYYYQQNYKEAIKWLEEFSPKGDAAVSPLALSTLANCYAADKQVDKAVDTFKKAAAEADNAAVTPVCLVQAAMLLETQGKKAEAHEIYVQVKEEYPNYSTINQSTGVATIDQYIERTK